MDTKKLPPWATMDKSGVVKVDTAKAYDECLEKLGMEKDQFSLEVARRCVTTRLLELHGPGLHVKFLKSDEHRLADHPIGKGEEAGATGFRHYYQPVSKDQAEDKSRRFYVDTIKPKKD